MNQVERLKVAIEEVALVRTGCSLEWKETLDEQARTLSVGFVSDAEAHTLGRKLKSPEELRWDAEASDAARERGMAPMPYPRELLTPITPELVDTYRVEILRALLREGAVNVKF